MKLAEAKPHENANAIFFEFSLLRVMSDTERMPKRNFAAKMKLERERGLEPFAP